MKSLLVLIALTFSTACFGPERPADGGEVGDTGYSADPITDVALGDAAAANSAVGDVDIDASTSREDSAFPDEGRPPDMSVSSDAAIIDATLPRSLTCGTTFHARITVQNTSSETWTAADGYKLGAVDDDDPLLPAGRDVRVLLPAGTSVAPGESWTFTFDLVAPDNAGSYVTDWQMVHEGVRWFGEVASSTLTVRCMDYGNLDGKVLAGYQGWFTCPGDGSNVGWSHWFRGAPATAANASFDVWPDTSELTAAELCATDMTDQSGAPAVLFSSQNATTVDRHFEWMAQHDIDGVMLQRFVSELADPNRKAARDNVLQHVMASAEAHGRVFTVMYDISGANPATVYDDLRNDWTSLVDDVGVLASPAYLSHDGAPLLVVWGFGFDDRPGDPAQVAALQDWFETSAPARLRVTLMGGTPTHWRTLDQDSKTDPAWGAVYRNFDIVSPWAVGRYGDDAEADAFAQNQIAADLVETGNAGIGYMPVVFPGFSWINLNGGRINQIPRRGGRFLWRQLYDAQNVGATSIFVAMFDEYDEGTAIMNAAPTAADLPSTGTFLSLDADGETLPASWYLDVAAEGARMLRGEVPPDITLPLSP